MMSTVVDVPDRVAELLALLDSGDATGKDANEQELDHLCYPRAPASRPGIIAGSEAGSYIERSNRLARESGIVAPLEHALLHGGPTSKAYAATRLGFLRDERAFEPLIVSLANQEPVVRRAAARALHYFRDARAIEPLIVCLTDWDEETACDAAWSLGQIGNAMAVPALIEHKCVRRWRRRQAAYFGLAPIIDSRCVEAARFGLTDVKPQVRKAAKSVLARAELRRRGKWP